MQIVVLAGSPHQKGTSNILVNEFIRGAKELGKEVEIIDLVHTDIHPWLGGGACGMDGNCVQYSTIVIGGEIYDLYYRR